MTIIIIIVIIGIVVFLATRKKQQPTKETKSIYQRTVSPTLSQDFSAGHIKDKEPLVYLETLNFNELPKSIISHLDIVRTVSKWNELGFKPKRKGDLDYWNDVKSTAEAYNNLKNDSDIAFEVIHTSGHATVPDLLKFAKAINPRKIVPIHTGFPETFKGEFEKEGFKNINLWEDGKEYQL